MRLAAALAALPLLCGTACVKGGADAGGRVVVVAGAYPLAYVAREVGGAYAAVTDLTPTGAEPHDVELTPSQVGAVGQADLVLLVRGFQPALDDVAPRGHVLDARSVGSPASPAVAADPHVWLDPRRLRDLAQAVAARLGSLDGAHRPAYESNASSLAERLDALDADLAAGLRDCARREVVTSHAAFGHFAARYGLVQTGISGISPDAEPSPRRLADVAAYVRAHGVTTVFAEALLSPKVAETVARETGARVAVLDPVEGVRGGDDYVSVMRRDLAALRGALGCR